MRRLLLIFILVLLATPVWAKDIAGVAIDDEIVVGDTTLQLNGAGIRKKFFFKVYIAELYLEKKENDAAKAIASEGTKRVVMHFLYDKVGKDVLVEAWDEGFSSNVDAADVAALQPRIDKFNAMFDEDVVAGDEVVFTYKPDQGTQVSIKGEDKGVIDGKDFNEALLSIWLGSNPVTSDLKKALLKN